MEINNELRDRAYQCACKHGFHDKEYSDEHWLMLIITEIGEAVNADRKGKHAGVEEFNKTTKITDFGFMRTFERYIKDSVCDELSDVVIRCLDFAGLKKIDIDISKIKGGSDTLSFVERMYWTSSAFTFIEHEFEFGNRINDTISELVCLTKEHGFDLLWFIEQKMRYNELREPMHGKKY